jgi:S-formylglutathione hydrolase FrmB
MALMQLEFMGKTLGKASSLWAILPQEPGPYPVLYLLHGYSDNHTAWMRRTSLERYAEGRKLIIVMPDAGVSYYCNDPRDGGLAYEDFMLKDVVRTVDRMLPTIDARAGRGIAGLSMGGYGAMKLALKYPELFAAASSLSGALEWTHGRAEDTYHKDRKEFFEAVRDNGRNDCFQLAGETLQRKPQPRLRFDCGTEDFLLAANRNFHAHLEAIGYDHVYVEYPGEHNWDYWDAHLPETLDFMTEHLQTPSEARHAAEETE